MESFWDGLSDSIDFAAFSKVDAEDARMAASANAAFTESTMDSNSGDLPDHCLALCGPVFPLKNFASG
eukprot:CAMPEP_0169297356 /NCGR_PEP_ID=MMETSP1016-20121227/65673_1 /TAXON_ID=342587 /ORGANISM="Karlodinium micrum, Strain CCMP2283" /LENGTH=67 /DNA_ID=CAMNT_0009388895 /DNA_START=270 /DNA_END=473 /DNA_ORIENTATION=+